MTRIVAAATLIAALVAAAPAAALPDLTISLPQQPSAVSVAPVYLDAYQEPGRLLYRFDALIHDEGSTLDLYRDETTGHVMQALWDDEPDTAPDPDTPPSGVALSDRSAAGARIEFVVEETHAHFHFFTAARYELDVPGAPPRASGKIGFCMFDSFGGAGGPVEWFQPDRPWCHEPAGRPGFARMGLSPGAADRYSAQREFQYVDVTGLAPGNYTLRGVANPEGHVLESDGVPDVHEETRLIPGVVARAAEANTAGAPVAIPLSAEVLGGDIPARRDRACVPRATVSDCYVRAADGPVRFAADAAAHGSVTVSGSTATYAPVPGFSGDDRFTFTATDARGLTSARAVATVHVSPTPGDPPPRVATPRRILTILSVRRTGRRTLKVRIRCRPSAVGACAGRIAARARGRAIGARRFETLAAGRTRTLKVRHTPSRRRVTVRATVRDNRGLGVPVRRPARR